MDDIDEKVLAVKMVENDAEAETVKDYLKQLLTLVWDEEEGFDGKRPFGNSGWQHEIFESLNQCGFDEGNWDQDDLIRSAIDSL